MENHQRRERRVSRSLALCWVPRVLGLFFAVFISLFALDVFGTGEGFWPTVIGFLIHMLPTALVLLAVAVAWRRPRLGGLLFLLLAVGYVILVSGRDRWSAFAILGGPALLVGLLFLIDGFARRPEPAAGKGT